MEMVNQIQNSLKKHEVVVIHGNSGTGKSTLLREIKKSLIEQKKKIVYLDMRHVRGNFQLKETILKELNPNRNSQQDLMRELNKGDITFLLDEYWAGTSIGNTFVQTAYSLGNNIVITAGNPSIPFKEYILSQRN